MTAAGPRRGYTLGSAALIHLIRMNTQTFDHYHHFIQVARTGYDFIVKLEYRHMTGDWDSAIMLSKIVYWFSPRKAKLGCTDFDDPVSRCSIQFDGHTWLAKRYEDWQTEAGLTVKQARRSLANLKSLGLIDLRVRKFGGSPTVHITLNADKFIETWHASSQALSENF
jgi:hypothetical protein